MFLATGLHDVGRPDLGADDEEADLETHWIPLADAVAMVFEGTIVNSSCVAAVLAVHAVRTGAARTRARPTRRGRTARPGSPPGRPDSAGVRAAAAGRACRSGARRG